MALEEYKKKRSFSKTPEPEGGKPKDEKLHFVIQKHAASHLHYDFRLELRGVLKSWAVPKGPSLDPEEKRLAMMTEDHPYDYKDFEGIIPKGQYGGGTVIIWDEGTYETPEIKEKDKKSQEHSLTSQFYKGGILLTLYGKKLKGTFAIIKAPGEERNAWYLLKVKDKYATTADVTRKDKSVISGLTIDQMAANAQARKWQSNRKGKEDTTPVNNTIDSALLAKGKKAPMPASIQPMNATLIKEIFENEDWVYEVKWDGYRIVALIKDGKVNLQTRGGQNYTVKYPVLVNELQQFTINVVLDGEVCALDVNGKPNFDALQTYKGNVPMVYYVFDILWADGYDVTGLTILERKQILKQLLPAGDVVKFSEHFEDGRALWEQVQAMDIEGIVAKRKDSRYEQNTRTKNWLKLPTQIRQEFVIGGWTESESGRSFRSLLFGNYENGKFMFVGHAGGGFKDKEMKDILARLKKLEIKKKPFANEVDYSTTPHWVKPQLVANFKFATWTKSGKIRKPATFLGFRDDKGAIEVVREVPLSKLEEDSVVRREAGERRREAGDWRLKAGGISREPEGVRSNKSGGVSRETGGGRSETKKERTRAGKDIQLAEDSNWRELDKISITSQDVFDIEGKQLTLTNVEKQLWSNVTKSDLIIYYHNIAPWILPYLKDRPQSMHIKHISPVVKGMYIKDMEGRQPAWAEIFRIERKHKKKGKRDIIDYLVCNDEATLLYMVNLGCIDINPWTSRTSNYLFPDYIIIDLDPSDDDFKKVVTTATAAKQYFDEHKLKAFPKTSGKTGLHLYLPCDGFTFPQARAIAEHICEQVHKLVPAITTTEVSISKRGNRLYIDPNQNDEADTVAAPYCVRPHKYPTVSTPLQWKEINEKLDPLQFTMQKIMQRIEKKGDLFTGVMDKKIAAANTRVLKQLL